MKEELVIGIAKLVREYLGILHDGGARVVVWVETGEMLVDVGRGNTKVVVDDRRHTETWELKIGDDGEWTDEY